MLDWHIQNKTKGHNSNVSKTSAEDAIIDSGT